ncbi:unnamed protein product [Clonostachys chloroleuca]|uniref:Uncharacterized protein n=1 Tax=Clonostachys chloroleuca TaxID=1926264 RepID=A0AA35M538_9HYPO|nr:unnamed protein product [Clonostachys chloroleuca]
MPSQSRPSRSSRSRTSQRQHQRKHHDLKKNDPEYVWRCNQYALVRRLQSEVEERYQMVRYTEADLLALGYKLGAPLDVDDPKPLDLDSRFFVPPTRRQARTALRRYAKTHWVVGQPLKIPHRAAFRGPDADDKFKRETLGYYSGRGNDANENLHYFVQAAMMAEPKAWHWTHNSQSCRKGNPAYMRKAWFSRSGEPVSHECGWKKWTYSEDAYSNPVSTIPHALGAIYDNIPAKEQQVQKSELYLILVLIGGQLKQAGIWPRHRIIPALAISFHSRFTARIVQAHLENGQVVLRLSRLLNLHTAKRPVDGKIIIKWLGCRPMGDTRMGPPPVLHHDDRGEETVEDKADPAQSIAIVG